MAKWRQVTRMEIFLEEVIDADSEDECAELIEHGEEVERNLSWFEIISCERIEDETL